MKNPPEAPSPLTHLSPGGESRMVDVSGKEITTRTAVAKGSISMTTAAADAVREGTAAKGEVLQVARIAAIQAAKQTSGLIPLCHIVPLEKVAVHFEWADQRRLVCTAEVTATAKTGVEMEALTAVSVGLLTIYDMLKAVDRGMTIHDIALWRKQGGVRGDYQREGTQP